MCNGVYGNALNLTHSASSFLLLANDIIFAFQVSEICTAVLMIQHALLKPKWGRDAKPEQDIYSVGSSIVELVLIISFLRT